MKLSNWIKRAVFGGVAIGAMLLVGAHPSVAATAPSLGTAESFAVLGGTTVTNTGATTITGDLGVSPGSAITDTGSITLTGSIHTADAVALQAQNDVITAYDALTDEPCTQSFTGTAVEIGGQTLVPGVYCYSSSVVLTGTLTLNGDGVFIFKMGSTLTTASGSNVALIGGAQPCNVFWQVASSADLFTSTTFVGNILALTSINLQTGATLSGRALARNGAVTMDTNVITNATSCVAAPTATPTNSPTATPTAPSSSATPTAPSSGGAATATMTPGDATPSAPPASPIEQATVQATPPASTATTTSLVPDLPRSGGNPPDGKSAAWLLVLLVGAVGGLALASGVRLHPQPSPGTTRNGKRGR